MEDLIIWLDQPEAQDSARVGHKAANLSALVHHGLLAPPGFCIPASLPLDDGDARAWLAIFAAYHRLAGVHGRVAVRSSGLAEDLPGASFAGQYETVLDVQGEYELRQAILRCRASARSSRVRSYQAAHRAESHGLAVLVQHQIEPQVSGILFTCDPLSGDPEQLAVEAVCGPGEALAGGRRAPIQARLNRLGNSLSGSLEAPLTPHLARRLARMAEQVESVLGPSQDIEWALAGEDLYILQARPVTRNPAPLDLSQVWTRANVGEVLPQPVTPLTWSVFRLTLLGRDDEREDPAEAIRRYRGRVYLRMDALLDSFSYLPGVTPAVMAQVLGAGLPESTAPYKPPRSLPVRLAQAAFFLDLLGAFPRLNWLANRLPPVPAGNIADETRLLAWVQRCFRLHRTATAYAIAAYGLLQRWLVARMGDAAGELLPYVLSGDGGFQSAEQGAELQRLAAHLRLEPDLRSLVEAAPGWTALRAQLQQGPRSAWFLDEISAFLQSNGARAAGEFELAVSRWREDPTFVLVVLRHYLSAEKEPEIAGNDAARAQALKRIRAGLGPGLAWLFDRLLTSYRRYSALRENLKYRLMEGYASLRGAYLEAGQSLVDQGSLDAAQDVFFLSRFEIDALWQSRLEAATARSLVAERRRELAAWEQQAAPAILAGRPEADLPPLDGELRGIASSPGEVVGTARVLLDPSQAATFQPGEILVAPHTDPGWTPLFLICKAVVTEIGGFLSHGATVAREYGIPCVVNVPGATSTIYTGDIIRVDGLNGRVEICRRRERLAETPTA